MDESRDLDFPLDIIVGEPEYGDLVQGDPPVTEDETSFGDVMPTGNSDDLEKKLVEGLRTYIEKDALALDEERKLQEKKKQTFLEYTEFCSRSGGNIVMTVVILLAYQGESAKLLFLNKDQLKVQIWPDAPPTDCFEEVNLEGDSRQVLIVAEPATDEERQNEDLRKESLQTRGVDVVRVGRTIIVLPRTRKPLFTKANAA